ncbi:MAG: hypothetical protein MR581_05990 [Lachnospiraceae bacterium]|nr:hypothetical protein [Lachnospiraceae bacterium]
MVVRKTTVFPARREEVFQKLQQFKTLQYIAAPYASFVPAEGAVDMVWKAGSISRYRFKLFGIVPFGTHMICIECFDMDVIQSRESNGYVSVWNHKILLQDRGSQTGYTDEVEIKAGWKTLFIWIWANMFYAHRQKKWLRLLNEKPE